MDIVQMYFSIRGRISRKPYWLALLPLIVGYAIADVMTNSADEAVAGPGFIIMLVLLWPSLAVQIKRWHDRDKSGWWQLISLVPFVGPIWAFVELGFLPGTSGANRYDSPSARRCQDYAAQGTPAENPYLTDPLQRAEMVAGGSSVKNSWRGA